MSPTIFGVLSLGFLLGLKHAFDPDHVVAVSTISSQTRNVRTASFCGISWGLGHTSTLLLTGFILLFFRLSISEKLALSFEFLIGLILILLGADSFRNFFLNKHSHDHAHGAIVHRHAHYHMKERSHDHIHKSFFIGIIHGFAGSAAFMFFILSAIGSLPAGLFFILIFGIGSILGMLLISTIIGLPFLFTRKFTQMNNCVQIITATCSIFLGFLMVYKISF